MLEMKMREIWFYQNHCLLIV